MIDVNYLLDKFLDCNHDWNYIEKLNEKKIDISESGNYSIKEKEYTIYIGDTLDERYKNLYHNMIFDLSFPIMNLERCYLFCDSYKKKEQIIVSILNDDKRIYFPNSNLYMNWSLFSDYKQEQTALYKEYLLTISEMIEKRNYSKYQGYVQIKKVSREEFLNSYDLLDFDDEYIFLQEILDKYKEDQIVKLSDVAKIYPVGPTSRSEYEINTAEFILACSKELIKDKQILENEFWDYCECLYDKLWNRLNISDEDDVKALINDDNSNIIATRLDISELGTGGIYFPLDENEKLPFGNYSYNFILNDTDYDTILIPELRSYFDDYTYKTDSLDEEILSIKGIRFYMENMIFDDSNEHLIGPHWRVKENDIIYDYNTDSFKMYYKDRRELTIDVSIIRCNENAEYLEYYLNSNLCKRIRRLYKMGILTGNLQDLPVIRPSTENKEIIKLCNDLQNIDLESAYPYYKDINEANDLYSILGKEAIEKLKSAQHAKVKKLIDEDLAELKTCYENGAYKATLILAGSIMEALLIEWVSEKDGKDYFKEDCYINGKKADLFTYIDKIEELERPNWMENAGKAHEIRKRRNLVHAKLCMKDENKINKETCRMVIEYLNDIIDSYVNSMT